MFFSETYTKGIHYYKLSIPLKVSVMSSYKNRNNEVIKINVMVEKTPAK